MVWVPLWVTRWVGAGAGIGHSRPVGSIVEEGKLESFGATRGQQSVSDGEAWLWAGKAGTGPSSLLGICPSGAFTPARGAGVPEVAGAHKLLALGSPIPPSLPCWKQGSKGVGSTCPWQVPRPPTESPSAASRGLCVLGQVPYLLWASKPVPLCWLPTSFPFPSSSPF